MKKNHEYDLSNFEARMRNYNIPHKLYHYTNLDSLIGIVDKKEIWFTNVEYLNDITEFNEGKKLFLTNLSKSESEFESPETYNQIRSYIEENITPYNVFSFSLSGERDSLDQWRAYANHECGLMIAFQGISGKLERHDITCMKVVYDEGKYEQEICFIIDRMKKWDFSNPDNDLIYFWANLYRVLSKIFLKKKNSVFKNEKEWKLFYFHREVDDINKSDEDPIKEKIKFRISHSYIIPYSVLDLNKLKFLDKTRFISEVLISPTIREKEIDQNRSLEGIKKLLTKNKIDKGSEIVEFSPLPYR